MTNEIEKKLQETTTKLEENRDDEGYGAEISIISAAIFFILLLSYCFPDYAESFKWF